MAQIFFVPAFLHHRYHVGTKVLCCLEQVNSKRFKHTLSIMSIDRIIIRKYIDGNYNFFSVALRGALINQVYLWKRVFTLNLKGPL